MDSVRAAGRSGSVPEDVFVRPDWRPAECAFSTKPWPNTRADAGAGPAGMSIAPQDWRDFGPRVGGADAGAGAVANRTELQVVQRVCGS